MSDLFYGYLTIPMDFFLSIYLMQVNMVHIVHGSKYLLRYLWACILFLLGHIEGAFGSYYIHKIYFYLVLFFMKKSHLLCIMIYFKNIARIAKRCPENISSVVKFCHNLSFWVLSQFEVEFFHNLSFWVLSQFEFCHIVS